MNKIVMYIFLALIAIVGGLTLIQIWVPLLSWDVYFKVLASAVVIGIALALVLILKSDLAQKKKMRDENYLD